MSTVYSGITGVNLIYDPNNDTTYSVENLQPDQLLTTDGTIITTTSYAPSTVSIAASGFQDKLVYVNADSLLQAANGITVDSTVSTMFDNVNDDGFGTGITAGNTTTYCGSCQAVYILLRTFNNTIPLSPQYTFQGTATGFETAIVKLSLTGEVIWAARIPRNTANETEPIALYHDSLDHITYVSLTVNNNGSSYVYDSSQFNGPPSSTLAYTGPSSQKCGFMLKFDEEGKYIVNPVNPYTFTSNAQVTSFSRSSYSPNHMLLGLFSRAATVTANSWGTPFTYQGYAGFSAARFNVVSDSIEWVSTVTGQGNYVSNVKITEDGRYLVHGAVDHTATGYVGEVTYSNGTVIPGNTLLPNVPSGCYSNVFFELEPTSGLPKWVNMQFQDEVNSAGYGAPNASISHEGVITATCQYGSNTSLLTISRQVPITCSFTVSSSAITSPGMFSASMNGQLIECVGLAPGTVFTFVDASNGTLSVPAVATATSTIAQLTNILPTSSLNCTLVANSPNITSAGLFTPDLNGCYVSGTGVSSGTIFYYIDASNGRLTQPSQASTTTLVDFSNVFTVQTSVNPVNSMLYQSQYDRWTFATTYAVESSAQDAYGTAFVDSYDAIYVLGYNYTGTITFSNLATSTAGWGWIAKFTHDGDLLWTKIGDGSIIIYNQPVQIDTSLLLGITTASSPVLDGIQFTNTGPYGQQYIMMTDNALKCTGIATTNTTPTTIVVSGVSTLASSTLIPGANYYIDELDGSLTLSKYGNVLIGRAITANTLQLLTPTKSAVACASSSDNRAFNIATLNDIVLPIANGGTNSDVALTNGKLMVSSAGSIIEGTSSSTPSFTSTQLSAATNQLILGTNTTLTSPAPSAARVLTIPDIGLDSSFMFLNTSNQQNVQGSINLSGGNIQSATGFIAMSGKSTYNTGTVSQTGTVITGVGTAFTSAMVGGVISYTAGQACEIIGFVNATTLTASQSNSVASTTYSIYYGSGQWGRRGYINVANIRTMNLNASSPVFTDADKYLTNTGVIGVANGGTGSATVGAAGTVAYSDGSIVNYTAAGTAGQVLTSNGASAPTWTTPVISGVTSFSAGTTGLLPNSATTGAVTLTGTLAIANGGTNATATPTAGAVSYGTGSAYAFTAAGTAGQSLISNGASSPSWFTQFNSVNIKDIKANGTAGGTFTSGSFQTRTLTTAIVESPYYTSFATLATNQLSFAVGYYFCQGSAIGYQCGAHQARFRNVTTGTTILLGTSEYCTANAFDQDPTSRSQLIGYFQVTNAAHLYELQHFCNTTKTTDGFGRAATAGENEIYSILSFTKIT